MKIERLKFELDIALAFTTGILLTSTVFYYFLSKIQGIPQMSFAGSGILYNFYMPAQNWFWFTAGITTMLVLIGIYKTHKYFKVKK